LTTLTSNQIFCSQCGAKLKEDDNFCTSCGAQQPELRQANSAGSMSNTAYISESSSVSVDADGNLPICPQCHAVGLIWQKKSPPSWAILTSIIGIAMMFTFVLAIPGLVIWAIGLWGLLKPRQLYPYCPICKQFFL